VLNIFSGVGLTRNLKKQFLDAGVPVRYIDNVVGRMADQILHSKADGTISKYYLHVKQFKEFYSKLTKLILSSFGVNRLTQI
jgi:hypothetical protein